MRLAVAGGVIWGALLSAGTVAAEPAAECQYTGRAIRAESQPESSALEGFVLRLSWFDVDGTAGPLFEHASRELRRLLADAEVEIEWSRQSTGVEAGDSDVQVIVLGASRGVAARVMGAAQPAPQPPHSVRVFLKHVRQALGYDSRQHLRPTEQALLGRAVGRVIAHEIVHVYAPEHAHEGSGLMAAELDTRFLRQETVRLEPSSVAAVVGGLTRGSVVLAPHE